MVTAQPRPMLFDSFRSCIFERNQEGKLERLPGDIYWECEVCKEQFSSATDGCLHERSPDHPGHHCKERAGFLQNLEFVRQAGGGALGDEQVDWLRKIITDSLSEDAFRIASKNFYFLGQGDSEEKDFERYGAEWLLCFLFYARPAEKISPKAPSRQDWQQVRRIHKEFLPADSWRQAGIVRQLFDPDTPWEQIAKRSAGRPPIRLSPDLCKAFTQIAELDLHGKVAADELTGLGMRVEDGRTPRELYDADPKKFYNWVAERKRAAGFPPKKRPA